MGLRRDLCLDHAASLKTVLDMDKYQSVTSEKLSGGNKRKLCILLALLSQPELLIMDEPTNNLDPISRKKILNYIRKNNITTILITERI